MSKRQKPLDAFGVHKRKRKRGRLSSLEDPSENERFAKDGLEDAAKDGSEDAAKDGSEDAAKDGSEDAAKDGSEDAAKDGSDEAACEGNMGSWNGRFVPECGMTESTKVKKKVILVIDTNAFVGGNPQDIKDKACKKYGETVLIVVPYTVIQELDSLMKAKTSSKVVRRSAKRANDTLNRWLTAKDPTIYRQEKSDVAAMHQHTYGITIKTNDDKLIDCCHKTQDRFADRRVVMVTNDTNLQSKAMRKGFDALTSELVKPSPKPTSTDNIQSVASSKNTQSDKTTLPASSDGAPPETLDSEEDVQKVYNLLEAVLIHARSLRSLVFEQLSTSLDQVKRSIILQSLKLLGLFICSIHEQYQRSLQGNSDCEDLLWTLTAFARQFQLQVSHITCEALRKLFKDQTRRTVVEAGLHQIETIRDSVIDCRRLLTPAECWIVM